MNPAYFDTHFEHPHYWDDPPAEFAIITAYASTGETWTSLENESADKQLEADLRRGRCWMQRLTGYSPATGHAEPGWAVELDFDTACDLGLRFRQDAIYYVIGDTLHVTRCNELRTLVEVAAFSSRAHLRSPPSGDPEYAKW